MASTQPRSPRVAAGEARRRIVVAAQDLLATTAFRDLTVDAVMARAGLARTVFYRHFTGLPDLALGLLAQMRRDAEALAAPLDEAVATSGRLPTRSEGAGVLRAQLAGTVDAYARHGALLRALDDAARTDPAVERAYRETAAETVAATAAMMRRGIERGALLPLAAEPVARALVHMNGAFLLDALAGDPASRLPADVALDALWTVWSRTVGLSDESPAGPSTPDQTVVGEEPARRTLTPRWASAPRRRRPGSPQP